MAIGHDKRDLLRPVPRDRTKSRNKNYNATPNPRNEICTVLCVVPHQLTFIRVRLF